MVRALERAFMWTVDHTIGRVPGMEMLTDWEGNRLAERVEVHDAQTGELLEWLPSTRGMYFYRPDRPVRFERDGEILGDAHP